MGPSSIGSTTWVFSAGLIPARSTGHEPEFTSRNVLCPLNATDQEGCARITVYHEDKDSVGPYEVMVPASRVRQVRINELIDPEAVPLGRPYGMVIACEVPIVAQLAYVDTRDGQYAVAIVRGVPGDAHGSAS